jgi:hypothetical protein
VVFYAPPWSRNRPCGLLLICHRVVLVPRRCTYGYRPCEVSKNSFHLLLALFTQIVDQTMLEFNHLGKHAMRRWSRRGGGASARPHWSGSNSNSHKRPAASILDRRRYWLRILVVVTVVLPTTVYWAIFDHLQAHFRLVSENFD